MVYVLGNRVQHTRAALGKQEGKRRDWNFVKGMWVRKHCSAWQVLGGYRQTGNRDSFLQKFRIARHPPAIGGTRFSPWYKPVVPQTDQPALARAIGR